MRKIIIAILVVTLLLAAMALSSCQDHVHSFEDKVVKPTCVTKGYTEHTCSDPSCNYTMRDTFTEIDPANHSGDLTEISVKEPDCEMGYTTFTCTACQATVYGKYTQPEHSFDAWEYVSEEVSCPNNAVMQRSCEDCGYTEEKLVAVDHVIENDIVVAPTYYNSGYTKHSCDCGKTFYIDSYVEPLSVSEYLIVEHCDGYFAAKGLKEGVEVSEVIIPYEVNGVEVTTIDLGAFQGETGITSIFIPSTVTLIRTNAFKGCDNLTLIDYDGNHAEWDAIDKALEWAGYGATKCVNVFVGTTLQKEHYILNSKVVAPTELTSGYTYHYCACESNTKNTDYVAPKGSDALKLELRGTGDEQYYAVVGFNASITKNVIIPEDYMGIPVEEIDYLAFLECDVIESVTISTGIKYIRSTAFYHCDNLKTVKFLGTEEQWNAVSKGHEWITNTEVTYEFAQ